MSRQPKQLDIIKDRRPSVTNSAWASYRLEQLGLGVDPIAEVIGRGLRASLRCYDKKGNLVDTRPDYRTQMEAAKLLTEIHGFRHVPEQKVDVPVQFVQIVNEIKGKDLGELMEEAKRYRLLP